jgi:ribosome-binding factor A
MAKKRTDRLNSLLKEVISDVIREEVRNPSVSQLFTVTRVEITTDLRHAKVMVSVIGTPEQKAQTIQALQSAAGFIAVQSSHLVVMHHFPELRFYLDDSVDKQIRIEELIKDISDERQTRGDSDGQPTSR